MESEDFSRKYPVNIKKTNNKREKSESGKSRIINGSFMGRILVKRSGKNLKMDMFVKKSNMMIVEI